MKCAPYLFCFLFVSVPWVSGEELANVSALGEREQMFAQNGTVSVGVDAAMGASITHLSWTEYSKNVVNIHDPGRLIQQSYYAGERLDRIGEGQWKQWSPWTWNPIQGGGVGSWARVKKFEKDAKGRLFAETIPKLWDMPDEEAEAIMRQWTGFEPDFDNVVVVECEFESLRSQGDPWGGGRNRHQEIPALYFTRNFSRFLVYEGSGEWTEVKQEPGPPWGKTQVPLDVMGCFDDAGVGIATFSPGATEHWNFGPHGGGNSDDAEAGPCVHIAPLVTLKLEPRSKVRYRYWMVVGTKEEITASIDTLRERYSEEEVEITGSTKAP